MVAIHDRTRRCWTFFLFLLGVPLLTVIVLAIVLFRNGTFAARYEEQRISQLIQRPVQLKRVRYIRPEETYYGALQLDDTRTEQPILFCPEVHVRSSSAKGKNAPLLKSLRVTRPRLNDSESDFPQVIPSFVHWTIPKIYIRYSSVAEAQKGLSDYLHRFEDSRTDTLFFDIKEVILVYSDATFQQLVDDGGRRVKTRPSFFPEEMIKKTGDDWFDSADVSIESIQRWMKKYNAQIEGIRLKDLTGNWSETMATRQFDLSFRFADIPANLPVSLRWKYCKNALDPMTNTHRSSFVLDNQKSPIPGSFAAIFCSLFYLSSKESWFEGTIKADFVEPITPEPPDLIKENSLRTEAGSVFRIRQFQLRHCEVEPLANRTMTDRITGKISNLFLEDAIIDHGVFTGSGTLWLVKGTLNKSFVVKARDLLQLSIEPANTLYHYFANNEIPFDELAMTFHVGNDGITFGSCYPKRNRIIAFYQTDSLQYGFYLPETPPLTIPYPQLMSILSSSPDTLPFWSPLYREAIKHLPSNPIPIENR